MIDLREPIDLPVLSVEEIRHRLEQRVQAQRLAELGVRWMPDPIVWPESPKPMSYTDGHWNADEPYRQAYTDRLIELSERWYGVVTRRARELRGRRRRRFLAGVELAEARRLRAPRLIERYLEVLR